MLVYVFLDGSRILAKDTDDLVKKLYRQNYNFSRADNAGDYMIEVADRALRALHRIVRFDSTENFVADLQKSGFIVRTSLVN